MLDFIKIKNEKIYASLTVTIKKVDNVYIGNIPSINIPFTSPDLNRSLEIANGLLNALFKMWLKIGDLDLFENKLINNKFYKNEKLLFINNSVLYSYKDKVNSYEFLNRDEFYINKFLNRDEFYINKFLNRDEFYLNEFFNQEEFYLNEFFNQEEFYLNEFFNKSYHTNSENSVKKFFLKNKLILKKY